jgi:hypothetical protein
MASTPPAEIAATPVPVAAPVGDELIPNLNLYVRSKLSRSQVRAGGNRSLGNAPRANQRPITRSFAGPQLC